MTPDEQRQFEAELAHVKPGPVPEEFVARLSALRPLVSKLRTSEPQCPDWWSLVLRWFVPATALLIAGGLVLIATRAHRSRVQQARLEPNAALRADDVQVDRELVKIFDAVGRLPTGEPVRFRCREWIDRVTVSDKARGFVIEQRAPRMEIVPVRFETY